MRVVSRVLWVLWVGVAAGQAPVIGTIDFYGVDKVSHEKLRKALGVKEGDPLPKSRGDVEEALEKVSGVVRAHVEAQCCDAGKAILYVGVEEKGGPHLELREAPTKDLTLPSEVTQSYAAYVEAFGKAENKAENFREGHVVAEDLLTAAVQERLMGLAELHRTVLQDVVRSGEDPEDRAVAACVLGYVPPKLKRLVVDDLQLAMRDPEENVRLNAMRSLTAFAVLARDESELGIKVSPTWFVQALSSLEWKTRFQAALSLDALTEERGTSILASIRESAVPVLIEMAGWKSLTHALPSYVVLGRVVGLDEKKILEYWALGQRTEVLDRARKLGR
ncbi:MAG: hypothetical protein ABI693_03850 [Bryobacteraceae bacterium]